MMQEWEQVSQYKKKNLKISVFKECLHATLNTDTL